MERGYEAQEAYIESLPMPSAEELQERLERYRPIREKEEEQMRRQLIVSQKTLDIVFTV